MYQLFEELTMTPTHNCNNQRAGHDVKNLKVRNSTHRSRRFIKRTSFVLLAAFAIGVVLMSVAVWGATLYDSFADGDFTANPVWTGTSGWTIVANSDAAAGVTGSNTLRLNAAAVSQTDYLSSQIGTWGTSQEWGFWIGRRAQAFTAANQQYVWLYANESTLNNATVDGYRLAIGDDSGNDEIRLEYIVNGSLSATVITSSGSVFNGVTDVGFLVRVTRSSSGAWELFTSSLPPSGGNGTGAIATAVPDSTNATISQGTATHNTLPAADNGYLGVAALHSTAGAAIIAAEFDQVYFTQAGGGGGTPSIAISAAHPSAGNINQNSTNNIIGSIQLDVTAASATLTGLTVTTAGTYQTSDIQTNGFQFFINSTNDLTGATQLGAAQAVVASGGNVTVSGLSTAISSDTTRFLLVTTNVAYNAVAGRTISLASTPFSNITFTSATKTGTDPVAGSNDQTIAAVTPSIAISQVGPAPGSVSRGSAKNSIYQLSFAVSSNATDFTGLSVTTAGTYAVSDITANSFKLWYNTTNNLATAAQLGSAQAVVSSGGTVSFSGLTQKIDVGATGFAWVTVDVDASATVNNTISINATPFANISFSTGTRTGTDPAAAGGTQTIADLTAASDHFRSNVASGLWATPATWQSSQDGINNWITATLSPDNNANTITILSGHNVTAGTSVSTDQTTVDSGGQVTVNSGITLTIANGALTDLTVNGTVANAGTITPTGTISFGSGSKYQHNFTTTTGTIPAATWDANSTVEILGYTTNSSAPNGLAQTFGNFTWNCASQTVNLSLAGGTITATGTFTMSSTNTGSLRLGASTNGLLAVGNYSQTGGTIDLSNGTGSGTLRVAGAFNQSGGTITETGSGTTNTIEFNGTLGNQSVTVGTVNNTISYVINNAAGVTLGSNLTVNGTLALTNGDLTTTDAFLVTENGASTGTGDVVGTVRRTDLAGAVQRDFGNPNVEITIVSGDITAMDVTLQKGAPGGFASAVQRYYQLESVTGTVVNDATVKLHYRDSELQSNDPATLTLWRAVGSPDATWTDQGSAGITRATGSEPDNWVQKTGVTAFSPWTLASAPQAPTAVKLTSFKASENDGEVMLQWQTGYEARNLGYNIYREQNGKRVAITPSLVAGSALVAGRQTKLTAGLSYTWYDRPGQKAVGSRQKAEEGIQHSALRTQRFPVTYWLEDVDLDGTRTLHGPIAPSAREVNRKQEGRELRADLISEVSRRTAVSGVQFNSWADEATDRVSSQESPQQSVQQTARQALKLSTNTSGSSMRMDPADMQRDIAGVPGVKIAISKAGWYRVTHAELAAANFNVQDAQQLQLYRDGREVAISVSNDGNSFTTNDYFEFYGVGIDSPTASAQTYYLVNGQGHGKRIVASNAGGKSNELSGPQSFAYTIERKERMIYFSGLRNGDNENFFGQIVSSDPVSATLPVSHFVAASNARLEVVLQGVTSESHLVHVLFNGADLGTINFANTDHPSQTFAIPLSALHESDNTVELTSLGGASDISLIDALRLTYNRSLVADGNALLFSARSPQGMRISGFTNSNVRVLDISDPFSASELKPLVTTEGGGYAAYVEVRQASPLSPHTLLTFAGGQWRQADSVQANTPSSWWSQTAGANYVIFTTAGLKPAVEPLAQLRRSQGMAVAVVDIDDVYDEFSFGKHSPEAIRSFLERANKNWNRQPHFVLFAGDASYDPKNYLGQGFNDLVPTKLIDTALNETASDDWLTDFNGDGISDLAIGRLPVRTATEANMMVSKIINYENTAPDATRGALLVADTHFEAPSSAVQSLLPAGIPVQTINRGITDDATTHSQVIAGLNQGPRVANYFGHGSNGIWSGGGLLSSADTPALTNTTRLSVFTMMTCFNGYFHDAYSDSLSEALLKSPGGAVAVWASTTLTEPAGQNVIGAEFYRLLFGPQPITLGDAARKAKAITNDADVRRTWTLFGDPATRLR
jgi:hypothetical protein